MIKRLFLAIILLSTCLFASPLPAHAKDILNVKDSQGNSSIDCSGSAANSAVCTDNTSANQTNNPIATKLRDITDIVAYIAGAAAVIVILISALRYITSGSDISTSSRTDTDVEAAKKTIAGAVIGLVVIVLAHTLIVFLINKL